MPNVQGHRGYSVRNHRLFPWVSRCPLNNAKRDESVAALLSFCYLKLWVRALLKHARRHVNQLRNQSCLLNQQRFVCCMHSPYHKATGPHRSTAWPNCLALHISHMQTAAPLVFSYINLNLLLGSPNTELWTGPLASQCIQRILIIALFILDLRGLVCWNPLESGAINGLRLSMLNKENGQSWIDISQSISELQVTISLYMSLYCRIFCFFEE